MATCAVLRALLEQGRHVPTRLDAQARQVLMRLWLVLPLLLRLRLLVIKFSETTPNGSSGGRFVYQAQAFSLTTRAVYVDFVLGQAKIDEPVRIHLPPLREGDQVRYQTDGLLVLRRQYRY